MAKLYIFEGINEKRQLSKANLLARAGLDVEVHYHKVWTSKDEGMVAIPCNEKCVQEWKPE